MKKIIHSIAIMYFIGVGYSYAGVFDNIVDRIVSNNPDVESAMANARAETSSLASENNLSDPEIEGDYLIGPSSANNRWGVSISQSFDWPGVYKARSMANATASNAYNLMAASTRLEKRFEITNGLIDYVNEAKNIKLLEEVLHNLDTLYKSYEKGYSHGEFTILDVNTLKIERVRVIGQLRQWNSRHEDTMRSLSMLNGGNDCAPLVKELDEYPIVRLKDLEYYLSSVEKDPLIKSNSEMTNYSNDMARVASLSKYPGFSIGYTHNYEEGMHFNGITVGVTIPVFSQRHKVQAAKDRALAYETANMAYRVNRTSKVAAAYSRVNSLNEDISLLGPIFETTDNMTILKKSLDGGQISILSYIEGMNYFLLARQDYLDLQYRYNIAVAELTRYD